MEMRETVRAIQPFVDTLSEIETATMKAAKKTEAAAIETVHRIADEEAEK